MPLNILHLTTHLNIGGISSYIHLLGKAMIKRGHRVSVLSSGGALVDDFKASGIRCHIYPIRTKNEAHPKLYFHLVGILRLVQQEKFDVMHAHTRVTQVLAKLVSKAAHTPYVSTAHGFYKPRLGRRIFPAFGDRVIAISPLVAQELQNLHKIGSAKIIMAQNALDVEDLEARLAAKDAQSVKQEYGIPHPSFVVSCVSRLVEDKGHEFLIEAVSKLKRDFPSIYLVIVGEGREREKLEKKSLSLGLSEKVKFLPSLKDVTGILKITGVFVHPATYREGFGLSVMEAMIAKVPVVVTDIPAINAMIQNKHTGLVVPPKDADALAEAIGSLIRNSEESTRLAAQGYQMAKEICSIERLAGEVEGVYKEVTHAFHPREGGDQATREGWPPTKAVGGDV